MLAPVRADNRGPKAPFPPVENAEIQPVIRKRVRYSLELRLELDLTESTAISPSLPACLDMYSVCIKLDFVITCLPKTSILRKEATSALVGFLFFIILFYLASFHADSPAQIGICRCWFMRR